MPSIRLVVDWNGYPSGTILSSIDRFTQEALVDSGVATRTLDGGTPYSPNEPFLTHPYRDPGMSQDDVLSTVVNRVASKGFRAHFGAPSDGTTDCLQYAANAWIGKKDLQIWVEPGVYTFSNSIDFVGVTSNILLWAIPGTVTFVFPNSVAMRWLGSQRNIKMSGINLRVDMVSVAAAGSALYFYNSSKNEDVLIEDGTISTPYANMGSCKVVSDSNSSLVKRLHFRRMQFVNVGDVGITFQNHGGATTSYTDRQADFLMEDCVTKDTGIVVPKLSMLVLDSTVTAGATKVTFTTAFSTASPVGSCFVGPKSFAYWRKKDGASGVGEITLAGDMTVHFPPGETVEFVIDSATSNVFGFGISVSGSNRAVKIIRHTFDNCLGTGLELIGVNGAVVDACTWRASASTIESSFEDERSASIVRKQQRHPLDHVDPTTNTVGILLSQDPTANSSVVRYQIGQTVRIGDVNTTISSSPVVTPVTISARQFYFVSFTVSALPANAQAIRGCDALHATNNREMIDVKVTNNVTEVALNGNAMQLVSLRDSYFAGNTWNSRICLPQTGSYGTVTLRDCVDNMFDSEIFRSSGYQATIRSEGGIYPLGTRGNRWNHIKIDASECVNIPWASMDQNSRDNIIRKSKVYVDALPANTQSTSFGIDRVTCDIALTTTNGDATNIVTISNPVPSTSVRPGMMIVGNGTDVATGGVYLTSQLTGTPGGDGTYSINVKFTSNWSMSDVKLQDRAENIQMDDVTYVYSGAPGAVTDVGKVMQFASSVDQALVPFCDQLDPAPGITAQWGGHEAFMPTLNRNLLIEAVSAANIPHSGNPTLGGLNIWGLTYTIVSDATGGRVIGLDPSGWAVAGVPSGAVSFTGTLSNATSGTLSGGGLANGIYCFRFSNGKLRFVTVTGSTSASWTGAITATASATYMRALTPSGASQRLVMPARWNGSKLVVTTEPFWV